MYLCTSALSIYPSPPAPFPLLFIFLSPSRCPCLSLALSRTHSCTCSQLCTHLYTHTNGVCDVDRALCILTTSHSAYWLHHTLRTDYITLCVLTTSHSAYWHLYTRTTASTQSALSTSYKPAMSLYTSMSHVPVYVKENFCIHDIREWCFCIQKHQPLHLEAMHVYDMKRSYVRHDSFIS